MQAPAAFIAGVGTSRLESSNADLDDLAISAGTKALLDAGVTYTDVDQSIACVLEDGIKVRKPLFDMFGITGAAVSEVNSSSGLFTAIQNVRTGQADVVLIIGFDKELSGQNRTVAVGIVVVSQLFLTSHAYLKDSAALVRAATIGSTVYSSSARQNDDSRAAGTVVQKALRQAGLEPAEIQLVEVRSAANLNSKQREALGDFRVSDSKGLRSSSMGSFSGAVGLVGLCELLWQLRGWASDHPQSQVTNALQYMAGTDGTISVFVLGRADGKPAPAWETIQYLRDGRERLGHNPAVEVKDITSEDLEAVKADKEFVSDQAAKKLELRKKGGDRAALARL